MSTTTKEFKAFPVKYTAALYAVLSSKNAGAFNPGSKIFRWPTTP